MNKFELIFLCVMWLSCGIANLMEHSLITLIMVIGAIYITHHILHFKI